MNQCDINQFFCLHCRTPQANCVCHALYTLDTQFDIVLLTHTKERTKNTNSGFILQKMINANVVIWDRKKTSLASFTTKNTRQEIVLVYPTDGASSIASQASNKYNLPDSLPSNTVFILLDGTWQECQKMLNQSPALQSLPRLHLISDHESRFSLRRNSKEGTLSTCETGALLIKQYEPLNAQALNHAFSDFIQAYTLGKNNQLVKAVHV
jgi:DTW domain-containing protein YfiP